MLIDVDAGDLVTTAARVRQIAGQEEPAFSTRQMVAACFPTAVVTGRVLPAGVQEAVTWTPDGPVIVYSRALTPPAQRFVIAHAMAHLFFDGANASARSGFAGCPIAEERADAFAAELLVPLAHLESYVAVEPETSDNIYLDQVDEIASHFNVATKVIDRRIRDLRRRA